eukprot:Nk52_evm86s270 gene=Nk52_evmTU86s270
MSSGEGFDEYGFAVSELKNVWAFASKTASEGECEKCLRFLKKNSNNMESIRKDSSVKKVVRKGIPGKYRPEFWLYISGAYDKMQRNPGVFEHMLERKDLVSDSCSKQIEKDLHRTFPENMNFNYRLYNAGKELYDSRQDLTGIEGSEGNIRNITRDSLYDPTTSRQRSAIDPPIVQSLRRVLLAFAVYESNTGYCQGFNYIAGLLLLVMGDEEAAFWTLVVVATEIVPGYYLNDMKEVNVDLEVFKDILYEYEPKYFDHIEKQDVDLSMLSTRWFLLAFIDVLPIQVTLKVWDSFLFQGSKILFRYSVALMIMNKSRAIPKDNCNYSRLSKIAYKGIKKFSSATIRQYRIDHFQAKE